MHSDDIYVVIKRFCDPLQIYTHLGLLHLQSGKAAWMVFKTGANLALTDILGGGEVSKNVDSQIVLQSPHMSNDYCYIYFFLSPVGTVDDIRKVSSC